MKSLHLFQYAVIASIFLSLSLSPASLAAQSRYLPASSKYRMEKQSFIPAIIEFESIEELNDLEKEGAVVFNHRGNLALICYPDASADNLIRRKRGGKIQFAIENTLTMDKAREWYDASYIHSGNLHESPFTGKGVVVGLCDIGFDPRHPNFLASDGSSSRVAKFIIYDEYNGKRDEYSSERDFIIHSTDNEDETHATHVAGIMTGSYRENSYHGMAPDATLVAATSAITDVGLLAGAEDILRFAKENGKRAVINMSVSSYTGPHDGSSLFCRYIDMLGEEAVVVLSAGNEGNQNSSLSFKFSPEKQDFTIGIADLRYTFFNMYGIADIWSDSSVPFDVELLVVDNDEGKIMETFPISFTSADAEGNIVLIESDRNERFARYYEGVIGAEGGVDKKNNRFFASIQYDAKTTETSRHGPWAKYNLALKVSGVPGRSVNIFTDSQYSSLRTLLDNVKPSSDFSISDMATAQNVISVGMYNNRDSYPCINGESISCEGETGAVNINSSYATLTDGRTLPLTVAPGAWVVSSYSGPFIRSNPLHYDNNLVERREINKRTAFWGINLGTSMSAPYVAGTIACWLEANPNLTIDDIKETIQTTNRHDHKDPLNPRNGAGWFDPCGGLKHILANYSSINGIVNDAQPRLIRNGDDIEVYNPNSEKIAVNVYSVAGDLLECYDLSDTFRSIPLRDFPSGILIIRLTSPSASSTIKTVN